MAITSNGEAPLILNGPHITEEMARLRSIIEQGLGESDFELYGLREGENGEWIGVIRKKRS
jgi:hypothetical protein